MSKYLIFLILLMSASYLPAQPPAGAVPARPNIIYYAGGSCKFYDAQNKLLLSVDAAEAIWSATPAKAAWAVVSPANAGYYEFPNYGSQVPTCNISQYLQAFWKSDTVFNELVLLSGVNSTANLMFTPKEIISVSNYDFSQYFVPNVDFSVTGNVIKQLSARVSAGYAQIPGRRGNGQPNGLLNTKPTSWTCVTYIPDRTNWNGANLVGYKGNLLPNTLSKLKNGQDVTIQAYGMSITAGLNVSGFAGDDKNFSPTRPYMRSYVDLLENALEMQFGSDVTMINGSCGGKTVAWIDRYCESMVVPNQPDLVILDMGMNDIWGNTSNSAFRSSMQSCIQKIKNANPNTEFILIGNMLPDINSMGAPANGAALMYGFLNQLKSLESTGIAVFDMTSLSDTIYRRKGAVHCLSNSLHPNDYLARWYAQGLAELFNDGHKNVVAGKKYYVLTSGNNTDGLSPATAWTSLDRVNSKKFNPSDTILFESGKTFTGYLEFDSADGNDPDKPIVLSSYGPGVAKILTTLTTRCGFKATNTQGFLLSNLHFEGPGTGTQKDIDGILFYTNNSSGYLSNIQIENCEVSGFGYCGIRFYSNWDPNVKAGFKDVQLDQCKVHDCRENGIVSLAYDDQNTNFYHHKNFAIKNTEVYNITGYPASSHKGSGIVLSQIDSGLIEHCIAHHTGTANTACGGPGGIWVWSANRITIQFCESHHNSSGGTGGCDGLGFDLDGGVTNSIIQYCYSHDNDGPGYLLGNFPGARPWGNNTVRYCLSINDSRTNNSAVTLFTAPGTEWNGLNFYHNTIIISPSNRNKYPSAGAFQMTDFGSNMSGIACYNNIFQTSGPLSLISVPLSFKNSNPRFLGNLYWNTDQTFIFNYGTKYQSLQEFRNAGEYCEKLNGLPTGMDLDPKLIPSSIPSPVLYPQAHDSLQTARLSNLSPAIDRGLELNSMFGIDPGPRDFYGHPIPIQGRYDIGAHEWERQTTNSSLPIDSKFLVYPNPTQSGTLYIEWEETGTPDCRMMLTDLFGKSLISMPLHSGKNSFETHELPAGIYFINISGKSFHEVVKIIKTQ